MSYHGRHGLGADERPVLPEGCNIPLSARYTQPDAVKAACKAAWQAEANYVSAHLFDNSIVTDAWGKALQQSSEGMVQVAKESAAAMAADPKVQKALEDARQAATQIAPGVGFVPKVCEGLERYERPPVSLPAGSVLTMAYPFVKASDAQINSVLAALLTPKVPSGITVAARPGESATGAASALYMSPVLQDFWWDAPAVARKLTLLAAGWMPDLEGGKVTRGTLWVATAWDSTMPSAEAERYTRELKKRAVRAARVPEATLIPEVAAGNASAAPPGPVTEDSLKKGAFKSSIAGLEFTTLIQNFVRIPGIRQSSSQIASPLGNGAKAVSAARATVAQVSTVPSTVSAAIAAVQGLDPTVGQAQLQRVRSVLVSSRDTITAGVAAISGVVRGAQTIREEFLVQMRKGIIEAANTAIRGFREDMNFHAANEYYRCLTLQEAYRSLQGQVSLLLADVTAALGAATALIQSSNSVKEAVAVLDAQIKIVDKAIEDLPLSFWQRTTLGVPRWGLAAAGGSLAFLGLAFGVRAVKKKQRSQTSVKKNRRRR